MGGMSNGSAVGQCHTEGYLPPMCARPALSCRVILCVLVLLASAMGIRAADLESADEYEYLIREWDEGLTGPVNAIQKTPDGFLWIGTQNGLVRFDGQHFQRFSVGNQLGQAAILSLLAAPDGDLW